MNEAFYMTQIDLDRITLDLENRAPTRDRAFDRILVELLADFYQAMISDQKHAEPVWQPACEWKNYNEEKNFLYSALLEGSIEEASTYLENFWRNKLGLIVKEYATFEALSKGEPDIIEPFLKSILRNYVIWKDIYHLPAERLKMQASSGNPWGCMIDGVLVAPKATRYHHNALQLKNLLKACDGKVIGEIGAGYGALCHYVLKETSGVRYVDFDLPETLVLAAYYLISSFPNKQFFLYGEQELSGAALTASDVALLPNYTIRSVEDKSIDVFFNSFSLSEMPREVNAAYLDEIARLARAYFLHNNMDRSGVINRGFERIPASEFPIDENRFTRLNTNYDLFRSHFGDYKEFLYHISR